jgi:S-DNA-T family DNA segregation ATPase FtsK/SpoIIIE
MSSGIYFGGQQPLVTRKPLVRLPAWVVVPGIVIRTAGRIFRAALRRPLRAVAVLVLLWTLALYGWRSVGVAALVSLMAAATACAVWRWRWPGSYTTWVGLPLLGRWRHFRVYRRRWAAAMHACDLGKTLHGKAAVPRLLKVASTSTTDRLEVRMLMGQNPERFRARAMDIAYSFGARHVQVFERRPDPRPVRRGRLAWLLRRFDDVRWADRPARVHLVLTRRDCLDEIVTPFSFAATEHDVDFAALPVARSFLGAAFRLRLLASPLLIAGASRSGKGSVIWSLIAAMAPAVRAGLVRLWVIDPKGGMELAMGAPLFARFACRNAEEMADVLDEAVAQMRERQSRLAGRVRVHEPSLAEPLIVIVVDELGALTKYIPDTELRKRIEASLGLLLSQGAGLGFLVVGALQDPRKENLDLRDLFLSRIVLRVTAASHVDMVLGDAMRAKGAFADQIPDAQKGVAYVLLDGSPDPVKVRFSYFDDTAIRAMAQTYPAPREIPHPRVSKEPTKRSGPLLPPSLLAAITEEGRS